MRLPKRIYSKLLATADMEVKYKPKVCISICLSNAPLLTFDVTVGPGVADLERYHHFHVPRTLALY